MYNSIEIKNTFKVPLMSIGIVLIFALGVMIWLSSIKEFIYVVEADEIQAGKTITVDMIKSIPIDKLPKSEVHKYARKDSEILGKVANRKFLYLEPILHEGLSPAGTEIAETVDVEVASAIPGTSNTTGSQLVALNLTGTPEIGQGDKVQIIINNDTEAHFDTEVETLEVDSAGTRIANVEMTQDQLELFNRSLQGKGYSIHKQSSI